MVPQDAISQIFHDFAVQQRNGAIAEAAAFIGGLLIGIALRRVREDNRGAMLALGLTGLALCLGVFPYRWAQSGPIFISLLPWGVAVLFGIGNPDYWMKKQYGVR